MVSWIWVVQLPPRRALASFLEMLVKPVDDLRLVLIQPEPAMPGTFLNHQIRLDPGLLVYWFSVNRTNRPAR
jgi:hypothetical protein